MFLTPFPACRFGDHCIYRRHLTTKSDDIYHGQAVNVSNMARLEGLKRRIVVYPDGPVMKTHDGIDALPFRRFAEELASDALWKYEGKGRGRPEFPGAGKAGFTHRTRRRHLPCRGGEKT